MNGKAQRVWNDTRKKYRYINGSLITSQLWRQSSF